MVGRLKSFLSRHVVGFVLGAIAVTAVSVQAAPTVFGAMPFPEGCADLTNAALSTTSETVFAAFPGRKSVCITNESTTITIHVRRGATATGDSPAVPPGGSWCDNPEGGYQYDGVIDAIADSGTPAISGEQCR